MNHETRPADFYLFGGPDCVPLMGRRSCWQVQRLANEFRADWLVVEISPPVGFHANGPSEQEFRHLLICTSDPAESMFPISQWPCHVHVAIVIDDRLLSSGQLCKEYVKHIGRAEIHPFPY